MKRMIVKIKFLMAVFAVLCLQAYAVNVSSVTELKTVLDQDNVDVTMEPGIYTVTADDGATDVYLNGTIRKTLLHFSGNNSTYDFTGVTIQFDTEVLSAHGNYDLWEINVGGNSNVLKNLTMVDVGSVNDNPKDSAVNIVMDGIKNRIEGFHMTVKGSMPYAYGDAFGKGSNYVIAHRKHSAFLVRGTDNHVKGCTIIHRSYGHAIFFQGAWNPLVEDCYVEGAVRSTDDMLAEEGTGSKADNVDFMTVWGYTLPAGYMMSLSEEGVRAYGSGSTLINGESVSRDTMDPTVINCTVKFMRTGVNIGAASGTSTAIGNTAIGCEAFGGASVFKDNTMDVSYGSAAGSDVTINQLFESYNGQGRARYISGSGNTVTIRADEPLDDDSLQIVVGGGANTIRLLPGSELDYQNDYTGSDNIISNLTDCPVLLSTNSENNTVYSYGPVTDLGTGNSVTILQGFRGDNLALNGVAAQSSTDWDGFPELAIDGNTDGKYSNDSVTHTETEAQPWWQVDLGDSFELDVIEIWGRTDTSSQPRLSNYDVFVYDESSELVWSNYQADYPDPYVSLDVGGIRGRYVKVQLRGDTEPLSLAEVRVSGTRSGLQPYLVGEWTFDNQTLVNSGTSGMTHDGTFMNSTGDSLYSTDTRSGSGYSLKIDSIDDSMTTKGGEFLKINNSDSDDAGYRSTFASHAFTVSMWVKTDGAWRKWDEFGGKGSGDDGDGWGIRARLFGTDDADGLRFDAYGGGGNAKDSLPYEVDLEDQQWHLITATYDGSTMNLYLDGLLLGTADDAMITDSEAYPLVFGARDDGSRGENILVDDIQFYSKALSSNEVAALAVDDEEAYVAAQFSPSLTVVDGSAAVQFSGTVGEHYQLEYLNDLSSGSGWQTVTNIEWLTTSPAEVSSPITNSAGFYRLKWIP